MRLSLVLGLLFVSLNCVAADQNDLSPDDAVKKALESNGVIAAGAARVKASEGMQVQAGLKPNPRFILQTENARVPVSSPFRYSQDTDNFGYVAQVFEAGGKRQSRIDVALQNVRASELSVDAHKAQIAARVLTAYWSAVGAQHLATVLADSLRVLDRTVQYHRDRVREGSLPEADLIRVELEQQQTAINFRNAEQEARRSVLLLYREMGVPERPDTTLTGDLAAVGPVFAVDVEEALSRRPDVQLARQAVRQSQAGVRLQKANAVPDPEVIFGYKRTAGFDTAIAGVQVNLPIRNRNQGAIAAASAEQRAAELSLNAAQTAARTEIIALQRDYDQKRQLVEQMLPKMRTQASETSRIAEAVYREGASDLLRLLDAERVRLQSEMLSVRTLIEYRLSAVSLQSALGLLP